MSYDLFLFEPKPGESAEEAIERLLDDESDETLEAVPEEFHSKRTQHVVAALVKMNPSLEVFSPGESGFIELGSDDDGNGIQIGLYDDSANLKIPYWHKGDQAAAVFREVWSYLETIRNETGFNIFDPQLEVVIDLAEGYSSPLSAYLEGVAMVDGIVKAEVTPDRKPWWKFW